MDDLKKKKKKKAKSPIIDSGGGEGVLVPRPIYFYVGA